MTSLIDTLVEHVDGTFARWVEDQERVVLSMNKEDLEAWLNNEDDSLSLSVGDMHAQSSNILLKKFVVSNRGVTPQTDVLALSTRLALPQLRYAIAVQHLNTNSGILFQEAITSAMMAATAGWRDETELQARLVLQELAKHSIQRGKKRGGGRFNKAKHSAVSHMS